MAINNTQQIDFIGTKDGVVTLLLIDHLPWTEEATDAHISLLKEKFSTYISFILDGGLKEKYPNEHKAEIKVDHACDLNEEGKGFFSSMKEELTKYNINLTTEHHPVSDNINTHE